MGVKRALFERSYALGQWLVGRSRLCRHLAWELYTEMTKSREQWIDHEGMALLVNIYDRGIGTRLYFGREYGKGRIAEIRRAVRPGDSVVDLGANIGYFTLPLARLVGPTGTVYAFEPDPRCVALMRRSLERNALANVAIEQKAVSNTSRQLVFYLHESWTSNALAAMDESAGEVTVPVLTLDEYLPPEREIRFVKMDIDGSEPLVLKGMERTISRSPHIQILTEYQPGNLKRYYDNPLGFVADAEALGLRLEAILDTDTGRLPRVDLDVLRMVPDNRNLDLLFVRRR